MNDLLSVRSDQWITLANRREGRAEATGPRHERSTTRSAPRSGFVQLIGLFTASGDAVIVPNAVGVPANEKRVEAEIRMRERV
jgi:hypothetical protein